MSNTTWVLYGLGVLGFVVLLLSYILTRKAGSWALDSFILLFAIQYGPHSLWVTPFHRVASLVSPSDTDRFLVAMALAYLCVAAGLVAASFVNLRPLASRPFPLLVPPGPILAGLALLYLCPFVVLQGISLPITTEYLRAFSGASLFDYDELRREIFAGSPYERLASITRQTTTALLFSYLICNCTLKKLSTAYLLPLAMILFVVCAMQMNKFPFVYYFMLVVITYLSVHSALGASFDFKGVCMLALGVVLAICILVALYCFQYDRTVAEVREVLVYRIFYCSSDVLRLWFDYFPAREPFVGLAGIPLTAAAAGLDYVNPTVVVPESLRTGRITSFQVGFIGSGYAFLGFLGVIIYSCLAGAIAGVIGSLQSAFRNDIGAVSFFAVLTLNVFFLTTRELHTAMLSGGTVSVLILFLSLHWLLRPYARPRRT